MDIKSRGEGNPKLKRGQNDTRQSIVLRDQDCLIVLPNICTKLHFIKVTRRFTISSRAVDTRVKGVDRERCVVVVDAGCALDGKICMPQRKIMKTVLALR